MEELTATQERMESREKELEETLQMKEEELEKAMKKASYTETELKENTAILDSLLRGLEKALVLAQFNTAGNLILSNKIYQKLFLKDAPDEIHTFWDTIPQAEKGHFKNKWKKIAQGEVFRGMIRNETPEGKIYYLKTAFLPITDSKGAVVKILYLSQIITNQEEADIQHNNFMHSSNETIKHSAFNINNEKDWEETMKWLS